MENAPATSLSYPDHPRYAIVTGANSGIGFRAAQMLAGPPHRFRVVLACRHYERGIAAQRRICDPEYGGDPTKSAIFMRCDLANLGSIREFVTAFRKLDDGGPRTAGLALLVCNAGVGYARETAPRVTANGFEEKIGVNHLGHFLLTNLLLPDLQRVKPEAVVVVVSSSLHDPKGAGGGRGRLPTLELDDLHLFGKGASAPVAAAASSPAKAAVVVAPVAASPVPPSSPTKWENPPSPIKWRKADRYTGCCWQDGCCGGSDCCGGCCHGCSKSGCCGGSVCFSDCFGDGGGGNGGFGSRPGSPSKEVKIEPPAKEVHHTSKGIPYESAFAYKRSKLANLLFAYELKRRLHAPFVMRGTHAQLGTPSAWRAPSTVRVVSLCPGFIPSTNLIREAGPVGTFFLRSVLDGPLAKSFLNVTRTIDEGAACIVMCATSDDAVDGGYHRLSRDGRLEVIESSEESYDEAKAKKLWSISAKLTASQGSVGNLQSAVTPTTRLTNESYSTVRAPPLTPPKANIHGLSTYSPPKSNLAENQFGGDGTRGSPDRLLRSPPKPNGLNTPSKPRGLSKELDLL